MDMNFAYGINPATLRDRYYEAHDLVMQAWTRPEMFAFNGKYTQVRYANIWPQPLQKPHPPVWIPGGGSVETWEWTAKLDYVYCYLSYFGYKRGRATMDGFWEAIARVGADDNPFRAGFLQLVCVSETDAQAEREYFPHVHYFYQKCLNVWEGFSEAPGYRTVKTGPERQPRAGRCGGAQGAPVARLGPVRRPGLHHRRQPEDGSRAARGLHQEPARRAPDGPAPDREHAEGARVQEHGALREGSHAARARHVARLQGPLVAVGRAERLGVSASGSREAV
jgi:alkanesulfonate monooxygenase SsuD/methylene tetrahydromethanopterin reductase-like flavin-dependent oxidoreductase (luciferase family)